ncbi:MAG: zinc-binding dehydrogenase [Fibrobacteria bacterium]
MKAIVCMKYGPPEALTFEDVEKPVPKDGEILVKVRATTVTVADIRVRSFTVPPSFWLPARLALGLTRPRNPILGVELAGTVESVGRHVKRFQVGDKVFAATLRGFGAYAEYKCLRETGPICLMPSNLGFTEAAALPIGARTAMHYLKKAGIGKGSKVLEIKDLVEAGKLKAVIDRVYPFDSMVEAHHYVGKGHKKGNVAITMP